MDQIQTRTVTTERFEERIVIKQQLVDQRVERGQSSRFTTIIENADNIRWTMDEVPIEATTPGVKVWHRSKI